MAKIKAVLKEYGGQDGHVLEVDGVDLIPEGRVKSFSVRLAGDQLTVAAIEMYVDTCTIEAEGRVIINGCVADEANARRVYGQLMDHFDGVLMDRIRRGITYALGMLAGGSPDGIAAAELRLQQLLDRVKEREDGSE